MRSPFGFRKFYAVSVGVLVNFRIVAWMIMVVRPVVPRMRVVVNVFVAVMAVFMLVLVEMIMGVFVTMLVGMCCSIFMYMFMGMDVFVHMTVYMSVFMLPFHFDPSFRENRSFLLDGYCRHFFRYVKDPSR